jgi:hypothetical protein
MAFGGVFRYTQALVVLADDSVDPHGWFTNLWGSFAVWVVTASMHDPTQCDECGRRETVTYRCTGCEYRFGVAGVFRWYPQGRGHWHAADDRDGFARLVEEHRSSHREFVGIVPVPPE